MNVQNVRFLLRNPAVVVNLKREFLVQKNLYVKPNARVYDLARSILVVESVVYTIQKTHHAKKFVGKL